MEQILREYELPYPIEKVKESIESVSGDITNKYPLTNKNEAFNSYSINIFFGLLHTIPTTIQLTKISDNQTKIKVSALLGPSGQILHIDANKAVDKYFDLVGRTLSGAHQNNPANKGCLVLIVVIGTIIITSIFS